MYIKTFLEKRNIYADFEEGLIKAFINHIRAGISQCNKEQYQKFLQELKMLLPDYWQIFKPALKKDYITPEYLKNFIGEKKVMLWGASLFIKQVLEQEKTQNPNIIGIIDKNTALEGKKICNYTIYSPEALSYLKPDGIVLTVLSNNESIYESLKAELREKYPNVEFLPNIFEEQQ